MRQEILTYAQDMVDHIKKSVAELEAPTCEKCFTPMKWFSAQLLPQVDNMIEHTFYCTTCSRTAKTQTAIDLKDGGSDPNLKMSPSTVLPFAKWQSGRAA